MVLSVMTTGQTRQHQLLAGNWAFHLMVQHFIQQLLPITVCIHVGAIGLTDAQFAEENNQIAINSINCAGTEERVADCNRNTGVLDSCGRFEDAGVVCQGRECTLF